MSMTEKDKWDHTIGWDKGCERMANPSLKQCGAINPDDGRRCLDHEGHDGAHYSFNGNHTGNDTWKTPEETK